MLAATGIVAGADVPATIYVASKLAPDLPDAIAVASYSYMDLVALIQPPILSTLTTRKIRMPQHRSITMGKNCSPIIINFSGIHFA